ncbi:uncharacterized protein TNCV_4713371 [Trichonephila clavipes]|nr:uncharacterized protein TNCV_4713371 [Trichonephila clavipes]
MWSLNDMLESLNMLNMCSIDINNVFKARYSIFNGSKKQLMRDFNHMAYNASFPTQQRPWVAWWCPGLDARSGLDRVRCPMPQNTFRVHTEYVFVKSVGPKVLWAESRVQGTGEYFLPLQSHCKIVEVEIGGVAVYRPFGEFRRANSYCHLYGAQGLGQRQAYF